MIFSASNSRLPTALTIVEVLVVLVCIGVLAGLGWGAYSEAKDKQKYMTCVWNLKHFAFASNQFASDSGKKSEGESKRSTMLSTNLGGSQELVGQGLAFRHFLALSNYMSAKRLTCPTDSRSPALDWPQLANSNLSYFMAVEFSEPYLLAGDRHLETRSGLSNGVATLSSTNQLAWGRDLHHGLYGVVATADGTATAWWNAQLKTNTEAWLSRNQSNRVRLEFP
ncbi:MAG: hypothetical protein WCS99_17485 [Limisphaerales bacterium]